MRKLIGLIVDEDSFFEIRPHWGRTAITGLARVNGYVVGVAANDPRYLAGAIDADGANKQTHFLDVCDTFNIPIVLFNDVPGFMVGSKAELQGTIRHGMRTLMANAQLSVPVIQLHVRKAFGLAAAATGSSVPVHLRMGWPSGDWGSNPGRGRSRGRLPTRHSRLTGPGRPPRRTRGNDEQVPLAVPRRRGVRHRKDDRPQGHPTVPLHARRGRPVPTETQPRPKA